MWVTNQEDRLNPTFPVFHLVGSLSRLQYCRYLPRGTITLGGRGLMTGALTHQQRDSSIQEVGVGGEVEGGEEEVEEEEVQCLQSGIFLEN